VKGLSVTLGQLNLQGKGNHYILTTCKISGMLLLHNFTDFHKALTPNFNSNSLCHSYFELINLLHLESWIAKWSLPWILNLIFSISFPANFLLHNIFGTLYSQEFPTIKPDWVNGHILISLIFMNYVLLHDSRK
jgi:hypothetical protein